MNPGEGELDAAGFVLAGGQSSRMGADKSLVQFAGLPLVVHALRVLTSAGISAAVAGARSKRIRALAPVIADEHGAKGPLGGVCAALNSAAFKDPQLRYAVFLPIDLPLLPPSLLNFLLMHARLTEKAVTLVSVNGFPQTFPAVLRREVTPVLQAELDAGRVGCYRAFGVAARSFSQMPGLLRVEMLTQAGQVTHPKAVPPGRWFLNVNTPEDLCRAEAASRLRPE